MENFNCVWTAIFIAVCLVYHVRETRVQRELSRLRVLAGEFSESDIDVIFRHALSLERGGHASDAAKRFQLVAEHSNDGENARLARESIRRINELSN